MVANESAILAMDLELDDEPLAIQSCYKMSAERVAILASVAEGLTEENAVAVTCTLDGETIETIVNGESLKHYTIENPIMMSEESISSFVEAQFEEDGPWILSRGTVETITGEKFSLFKKYQDSISEDPPGCLSTLRRMLQAGPITKLYSGGGGKFGVPVHGGFSLRMPLEDVEKWQMVNDKGEMIAIPRAAHALRAWNPTTRSYDSIDATLDGAPTTPQAVDEWFCGIVKKLKASNYVGSQLLDDLVTSDRTVSMDPQPIFEGKVNNRWTDLVLKTPANTD
jgi:hypothetical protein